MMTDPIADLITRIRNAQMVGKATVSTPASRLRARLLDVLEGEGFIRGYTRTDYDGGKAEIEVELKYHEGRPVITSIDRVSKPGRRVYSAARDLDPICNGLGISIISTSRGLMSDTDARQANVGGEILCTVI